MPAPDPAPSRLADLLFATARGEAGAFAELYRGASPKLFAVSLRIVKERRIAEEALQDSFVSIWNHAAAYAPGKSAPMTWMTAIVRNRSLDLLRRGMHEVPDIDGALAAGIADDSAAPPRALEQAREAHAIRDCLRELEADQRQSIALAFYEGL